MSLSPNLSLLAEACSLSGLEQVEERGQVLQVQEYPTMEQLLIPIGLKDLYILLCKEKLESQTSKRKEKIPYSNLLGQLQFQYIPHYYIITQGEIHSLVTVTELELMKTHIRTKCLSSS